MSFAKRRAAPADRSDSAPLELTELQLATLVSEAPEGHDWLHEQKFDGYRIVAEVGDGQVRLLSRRFKDWTAEFPAVAAAVEALPVTHAVLDGEVAAVAADGRTSFQALQNRRDGGAIRYFVFDLLELDGEDLRRLPLDDRKARLAALVERAGSDIIKYSDHVIGQGGAFFKLACERGLEGIVSKRRDKPYLPGRGPTWLKTKCLLRQELVIGGYTDPEGSRTGIGALLVGYYRDGALTYAGKVGTGFSHAMLDELRRKLDAISRATSPFSPEPPRAWTGGGRHWVAPSLVAEIAFGEWTDDGRLRHPSFQGLRADKPARDVIREQPVPSGAAEPAVPAKPADPKPAVPANPAKPKPVVHAKPAKPAKPKPGPAKPGVPAKPAKPKPEPPKPATRRTRGKVK
ncbi:MAG TPA: non-homologous end-joining DNA ligase [Kofleriaceae bacterium]